ncbi:EamA family transporter [Desulfallas sp. Bu1-1]|uniref:EamA family transporter n=1 Tax=Desulfallas sp. Bu1-1 TaxID=2787620 RepID=UPI00189FE60E|nr:EamA family transporter [Desulfallas sp. Bu1-1]MBF7082457.1 EamA family transporter [Desulfallas sp. Bu1-1]
MKAFTFALLTMVFWGLAPVFAKIGLIKADPFIGLALRTFVISGIILLYGILTGKLGGLAQLDFRSAVFLAGEGIFASLLGHLAYYHALKLDETSRIVPIVAAFPLVTVAMALLFLGEKFSWYKLVGTLFIIAGILLIKK